MDTIPGRPIPRGYPDAIRVTVNTETTEVIFPAGCTLAVQFREYAGAPVALATLTTGNGKIVRVDDDTILLRLDRDDTAAFDGNVVADIVRTDLAPDEWLGLQLRFPVATPVTVTVAG